MPLQHVYSPKIIDEMKGNKSVLTAISAIMQRDISEIPHTFMLHGPSGTGKTTLAYIIANMLGCKDAMLVDASDDRGIGSMRILKELSQYAPRSGRANVFILDEVHGLLGASQEAILKLLENPPEHSYFILCTTEPQKLKITLKRRCHDFELKLLNSQDIRELLQDVLEKEGVDDFPAKFVAKLGIISNGSAGVALKILDEIIDCDDEVIEDILNVRYAEESTVIDICRALSNGNWVEIQKLIKGFDGDIEALRRAILSYFEKILLGKGDHLDAANIMNYLTEPFENRPALTLALYLSCNEIGA